MKMTGSLVVRVCGQIESTVDGPGPDKHSGNVNTGINDVWNAAGSEIFP